MMASPRPPRQPLVALRPASTERYGFLAHGRFRLYCAWHAPLGPRRGRALLAGPFGLERQVAYTTWVRWARALAADGFEVLRFDYRGTGESTGTFHEACVSDWVDDARACLRALSAGDGGPVLLCGLRMGALVAAALFAGGAGDALLAWAPPASARASLDEVIGRKAFTDYLENVGGPRRGREEYIADLEAGRPVEIEGYTWSGTLWTDSAQYALEVPPASDPRPWMFVRLDAREPRSPAPPDREVFIPVAKPPFWWHGPWAVPDVSELFRAGLEFATRACGETPVPR